MAADLPDVFQMLKALDSTIIYIIAGVRYLIMIVSFVWMFNAILNLHMVATGGGMRLFPTDAKPTLAGSVMQFIVAGLLMSLSYNFAPAIIVNSMFNEGSGAITMYSVGSYQQSANNNDILEISRRLVVTVFYLMGFMGLWRGFSAWYHRNQGTSNEPNGKIITWIVLGGMCFYVEFLNQILASMIGYDFFGWLLKQR